MLAAADSQLCPQRSNLGKLLGGQFRIGKLTQANQVVDHQDLLPFAPLALEGPAHGGQTGPIVRPRLVLQSAGTPFDLGLEQIEGPQIDRREFGLP